MPIPPAGRYQLGQIASQRCVEGGAGDGALLGLVTNGKDKEVLMAAIRSASFSCVIADEAHYLKNKDAVRTQLVLPVLARARRCILCTGTPALSRPVELYPLLSTLRPDVPQFGGGYTRFVERYCAAQRIPLRGGASRFDVSGCSNAVELHDLLVRHCMVRRLKADVLTELPPSVDSACS